MLVENDKENEYLKFEVVLVKKKVQENNMNGSSNILEQIIVIKDQQMTKLELVINLRLLMQVLAQVLQKQIQM